MIGQDVIRYVEVEQEREDEDAFHSATMSFQAILRTMKPVMKEHAIMKALALLLSYIQRLETEFTPRRQL